MPGVRYGPDISDDAAYILDTVTDIQRRLAKGAKLSKKDRTRLDKLRDVARDLYGVRTRDFDRGKFGDLAELAKYGDSRSRSAMAKGRDGRPMRKSVEQEFAERGGPTNARKPGTSTKPVDGTYYVGRTKTKRFTELEAAAMRRARKNGVSFGKTKYGKGKIKPETFQAQIDKLNIAKARRESSSILNRPRGQGQTTRRVGDPIRPPLPASQKRNQRKQAERVKTVKGAKGKTGGRAKR